MQYLYHPDTGNDEIAIRDDTYRYIVKVRRHKVSDTIALRNLSDDQLHLYTIKNIDRRSAILQKTSSQDLTIEPNRYLHIGWCIIDPKKIEKTLPSLNELGVSKITFIHCDRSQSNFKIDTKRIETILLNSSQQCGRSRMMEIEFAESLESFLSNNTNAYMVNFSKTKLTPDMDIETIVIGCEGGFSKDENALFLADKIIGLDTPIILRSETAAVAVSSILLLSVV